MNITQKLISSHLVHGDMTPGSEIAIRIDQTLTQDSTGTMAYLQFEAMGIDQVKTKRSVAYIDHNMLQSGAENADDHKYIQSVAAKHGIWFSRPGNGICHQVQLERFSIPGQTLLGSDSHTPTCGAAGMLAIGAGGLDVAVAMGGGAYYLTMPKVCHVVLTGELHPMVSAKDVILEVLRRLSVKGGVGKVMEYGSARQIFKEAMHPYTQGLLASIPRLDKDLDRLFSIDGTVPSLDRMPKGCRFCARCLQAMDKCREHQPPVYITDDGHKVSCWKYENLKEEKV